VVGLGRAGGEDDLVGAGVEQGGDPFAGGLERLPRLPAEAVGAGGVAVGAFEEGPHRLGGGGTEGGGGVVVEIEAVHDGTTREVRQGDGRPFAVKAALLAGASL